MPFREFGYRSWKIELLRMYWRTSEFQMGRNNIPDREVSVSKRFYGLGNQEFGVQDTSIGSLLWGATLNNHGGE